MNWALKVWTLQAEGGPWGGKSQQESVGSVRLKKGEQWAEGEARQAGLGSLGRALPVGLPISIGPRAHSSGLSDGLGRG